jgi:cell wall-associated NlpC family hydrolase
VGRAVPRDLRFLRIGDLLTFGSEQRITHIGVYIGNGRYVHASSGAGAVVESRLDQRESSLTRAWQGVRRVMAERDSTVVAGG